jgi:hypothetical protein
VGLLHAKWDRAASASLREVLVRLERLRHLLQRVREPAAQTTAGWPLLPRGGDAAATRRASPRGTVLARIGVDRSGPRRRVRLRVRHGGAGSARPRARASMHTRRQCAVVRVSAVRQRNARQPGHTYDFSHCGWRGTQQRNFPKFRVSYTPNSDPKPNVSRAVGPSHGALPASCEPCPARGVPCACKRHGQCMPAAGRSTGTMHARCTAHETNQCRRSSKSLESAHCDAMAVGSPLHRMRLCVSSMYRWYGSLCTHAQTDPRPNRNTATAAWHSRLLHVHAGACMLAYLHACARM